MSEILVSNGRKLSPDPKLKDSDETNQPNDKKDEINAVKSEETNQRMEVEEFLNGLFYNISSIFSFKQINYFYIFF